MSCDLSNPAIIDSYKKLIARENGINWIMVGYQKDSRDVMELAKVGSGDANEVSKYLGDEVQFVFLRLDGKRILVHYIPTAVTGVRRARALVHGRQVATLFHDFDFTITITSKNDMSDESLHNRTASSGAATTEAIDKKKSFSAESGIQDAKPPQFDPNQRSKSVSQGNGNTAVEYQSSATNDLLQEMDRFATTIVDGISDINNPESTKASAPTLVKRASMRANSISPSFEPDNGSFRVSRSPSVSSSSSPAQYTSVEIARQRGFSFSNTAKETGKSSPKSNVSSAEDPATKSIISGSSFQSYVSYQPCNALLWKRKYIVLKNKTIFVYADELGTNPSQTLKLQSAKLSNAEEEIALPFSFKVELSDNSSYYFYTEGAPALKKTLEAFQKELMV